MKQKVINYNKTKQSKTKNTKCIFISDNTNFFQIVCIYRNWRVQLKLIKNICICMYIKLKTNKQINIYK